MTSYTTRFLAYAKTQGQAPKECLAEGPFIGWLTAKISEWRALNSYSGVLLAHHHQQIDKWLMESATEGEIHEQDA